MIELESFLKDQWQRGTGKGSALFNPSTEEALGTSSTEGLDFAGALHHARTVGGPALRNATFAQRGEMLRALSRAIHAHRDELIGLAIANGGNTRGDAKFDIDGASLTLAAYADVAPTLGEGTVLVDGDDIQLGRTPRLFGRHLFTSRHGAAVHINAFNFPAWGMAEKAAVALLAGMPVVSKPATSTALVAWRLAKIMVEANVLPPGAFQFVAGNPGDLLSHLTGQDVLAFTGSSGTGTTLRTMKSVVASSVRVNVEADSLNAAVLGPDVEAGSDLMNLFLGDVVRDATQKAGQKCTAIRRVYVPKDRLGDLIEAVRERLAAVKVGDPAREDVTMGPVATAQQQKDVVAGMASFAKHGRFVLGGGDRGTALGVPDGKGYFVAPSLLVAEQPSGSDPIHNHEIFGPSLTLMPYDGTAEHAAALVTAGGGGLVSSVYSDDKEFVRRAVLAIAPFHGRVSIGSSKIVGQAIPPGTVLAQLVHGGPGRAGSGEELGGKRGLAFYMQRTAVQGDRALLDLLSKRSE